MHLRWTKHAEPLRAAFQTAKTEFDGTKLQIQADGFGLAAVCGELGKMTIKNGAELFGKKTLGTYKLIGSSGHVISQRLHRHVCHMRFSHDAFVG